jgi:hypothetical protein
MAPKQFLSQAMTACFAKQKLAPHNLTLIFIFFSKDKRHRLNKQGKQGTGTTDSAMLN